MMKRLKRDVLFGLCACFLTSQVNATITGNLELIDSSGNVAATYQSGDAVGVRVTDADGNANAGVAETLTVRVTSETEDTGTPFSASTPVAGSSNSGDGTLTILKTSYDTKTENWTLTAVSQTSFLVAGSVSGNQAQQYTLDFESDNIYTTSNNEVTFRIDQGTISFSVGDTFTFSTTAGTVVAETVTLTETGVNTGIFEGSIPLVESAVPVASDNNLDVNSGDLITAFYDDAIGDWGAAVQVRSTSLYSATVIQGATILADTVWTAANSPYLITGDVTVNSGVTLTILEGVRVLFLANSDDQISGDEPYDSELIVNGTLNVAGTTANGVVFTSSNREPQTGEWGGIRINSGSASFNYATIEYSAYGVYVYGLGSGDSLVVANSLIQQNGNYGIRNEGSGYDGSVSITDSQIINNKGPGIYSYNDYDNWTITGNTITGNSMGIQLDDSFDVDVSGNVISNNNSYGVYQYRTRGNVVLSNNTIENNRGGALYFSNSSDSTSSYSTDSILVTDNVITGGGYYGNAAIHIYDNGVADATVSGNTIDGFGNDGIYVANSTSNVQPVISDNTVTNTDGYGIRTSGKVVPTLVGNILDGNAQGIYVNYSDANGNGDFSISNNVIINSDADGITIYGYAKPIINDNDIYGNGGYAIRNNTTFEIDAKNNWWGVDDTAEINSGANPQSLSFIYDSSDDTGLGFVNYAGWLSDTYSTGTPVSLSVTGNLELIDSSGNVAATYQSGDDVRVRVTDADGNTDAGVAEILTVRVTSETEDTGTPFSASPPAAGSSNSGDGTLTILGTSYDTKTEDWTLTAVSQTSFLVAGSVSGNQAQQYTLDFESDNIYTTSNNEVTFRIDQGTISFSVGDTFTFSTTAGTVVAETVTLTETGVDTGIFEGSIPLVESVAPNASDNNLDVNSGDLITAFYDDAVGDWGDPVQVRSTSLYSATVIQGATILADTVWTAANSPYLITGDVTVNSGVTLTILEGVQILFLANSDDQISGDEPYDSELIVNGTLNVAGTTANGVVFTSSNREPQTGEWGGIRINSGSASFNYATIEYSAYGVYVYGLGSGDSLVVANSLIQQNGNYGIRNEGSGYDGSVSITDSQIINNKGPGIYSYNDYDNWTITGNTITGNSMGIQLDDSFDVDVSGNVISNNNSYGVYQYRTRGNVVLSNNTIENNRGGALYFSNSSDSTSSYSTDSILVTDNVITGGGYYGNAAIHIYDNGVADATVSGNTIDGFGNDGIYVANSTSNVQPVISDNTVTNTDGYGIRTSGKVVPTLVGNILDGNAQGIYVNYSDANGNGDFSISNNVIINSDADGITIYGYAKPIINDNDIYGNGGYAIRNNTTFEIDAKNNWWGVDDTAEINSGANPQSLSFIYDSSDDTGLGFVNYAGWLSDTYSTGTPVSLSVTGNLELIDSSGNVAATYQSGDDVRVRVTDADGNTDAGVAEILTVRVTSETEDTGTPFSASPPAAGSSNSGDGTLTILGTSYDTKTEDWTLTAVSQTSFLVAGSVSGNQAQQYTLDFESDNIYTTSNNEVTFRIDQGTISFSVGDTFTFSTTAGTVVAETVTLTETGVDTGIFEGSIPLVESVAPNASDNNLDVNSGDLITAFYDDAVGDWGDPVQVRSTSLYSATVIQGATILADTVWTAANSPYLITGDVTVNSGVTLTILEGVQILFLANSDDQISGDEPYDSELIVNGTLNVAGTTANGVVFTSSNREPQTGEWGGIRINSGSASFNYATIEYSAYGVYVYGLGSGDSLVVANSLIQQNGNYGIRNEGSGYDGSVSITDSQIINNKGPGIYSYNDYDNWTITGNTITGNSMGIQLDDSFDVDVSGNVISNNNSYGVYQYRTRGNVVLSNNTIENNRGGALYFSNSSDSTSSYSTDSILVTDNVITGGGYYGNAAIHIYDNGVADATVSGNTIDGFGNDGIYVANSTSNVQPVISDNTVTNTDGYGIRTSGKVVPTLVGNILDGNAQGIYVNYSDANGNGDFSISNNVIINSDADGITIYGYAKPIINDNDIYGNGGYAIRNNTTFEIDAKNNWWGVDDTAEINSGTNPQSLSFIYDSSDDTGLGFVNYAGWLSSSVFDNSPDTDTDGDGTPDLIDDDDDNDGLLDYIEEYLGTDPLKFDTDSDGFSDGDEVSAGSDPLDNTSYPVTDSDGDGVPDESDPNPNDPDTDGDGIQDNIDNVPVVFSNVCSGIDGNFTELVADVQQCATSGSVAVKGTAGVMSTGNLEVISPRTYLEPGFSIELNGIFKVNSSNPCPACE